MNLLYEEFPFQMFHLFSLGLNSNPSSTTTELNCAESVSASVEREPGQHSLPQALVLCGRNASDSAVHIWEERLLSPCTCVSVSVIKLFHSIFLSKKKAKSLTHPTAHLFCSVWASYGTSNASMLAYRS